MADVEVIEVESKAQLKQFIKYPNELYRDDSNYVTPLMVERLEFFDKKKNPFYKAARTKLFLAIKDGKVCGRIATCENYRHNEYNYETAGFFGFFDTPDDYEIASKLLRVAMITLKKEGATVMRGPMNFSTNQECGFLVEGFDSPPMVMMTYNREHQPRLAEKFGLKKVMDLVAYYITSATPTPVRIGRITERLLERANITIRHMNMKDYDNEIQLILKVYNQAWSRNWGFVPMTDEEFIHLAKDMKEIVDPEMVLIAEHEGTPVAFALALPNINQALIRLKGKLLPFGLLKLLWHTKIRNKINSCRLVTFGVVPEYQKRGIDSLMYMESVRRGKERGYEWAEMSWVLETNDLMCRGCEEMGGVLYKRYRISEMPL